MISVASTDKKSPLRINIRTTKKAISIKALKISSFTIRVKLFNRVLFSKIACVSGTIVNKANRMFKGTALQQIKTTPCESADWISTSA